MTRHCDKSVVSNLNSQPGLLEHDEPLDSPPKDAKSLASELVVRKPSVSEPIVQTPSADEPPVNDRDILRTPTQLMAINNQERGRGRGRVLTDGSVLQSPGSAMSRSPSNPQSPVSSCSEYGRSPVLSRHGPISNKLASRNIVSKPAKQWAELTPNEYIEVDIGEFYSPYRIYVLLASEFSRYIDRQLLSVFRFNSIHLKMIQGSNGYVKPFTIS